MSVRWDLRLVPVAITAWVCGSLTLRAGWTVGAVGALGCVLVFGLAWCAPALLDRSRIRRANRGPRGKAPASAQRSCPPAGQPSRARSWTHASDAHGGSSSHGCPRPSSSESHARMRSLLPSLAVLAGVVALSAAAAITTALAATAPSRDFLTEHPPGSAVRVNATVTGMPREYTGSPAPGEQEASRGVVVPLAVHAADGKAATAELTVFAAHPGWDGLRDGDTVNAVVNVTRTANPARLTARATSPPTGCDHGCRGARPGLLDTVRANLTRVSGRFGAVSAGLIPGMTVGDTSQLPEALAQSMKDTGLTHLTAVSGSNCTVVMTLTGYAALTLGAGRRLCVGIGLAALAGFVLLVGPDPSVLRAGVMGALGGAAMLSGRAGVSLNALCVAVTGLVLVQPPLAIDFGFILSVLATAGIVVSARPVTRVLASRIPTALAACIAVPLVAQLWCGPALLVLNPALPLYSLPANMAAAPLVPVVTVAGLLAVCVLLAGHLASPALSWLLPGAHDAAALAGWERAASLPVGAASVPARVIAWLADGFAALPGAQLPWPGGVPGIVILTAVTLLFLGILHGVDHRLRQAPPIAGTVDASSAPPPEPDAVWRVRARRLRVRRRALAVIASLAVVVLVVLGAVWWFRPAPAWESVVCDVGQGDAVLHRTGEHSAVLVDGGPDPRALRRCLDQAGITHLDAVIATHNHDDHVAGLEGLSDAVDVERVWYSTAGTELPRELAPLAEKAEQPAPGARLTAGPLTVEVLAPRVTPTATGGTPRAPVHSRVSSEDENNASLVLLITRTADQGTTTWLTAGDLEADGYRAATRLLPTAAAPHADVLKVSHHGARNGGTDIIRDSDPALAVISVGEGNSYGHPHPATVAALQETGAAVARTDLSGSLWIRKEGNQLVVSTR